MVFVRHELVAAHTLANRSGPKRSSPHSHFEFKRSVPTPQMVRIDGSIIASELGGPKWPAAPIEWPRGLLELTYQHSYLGSSIQSFQSVNLLRLVCGFGLDGLDR